MRLHFRIPPFSFSLPWWIALPAFVVWLGVVVIYCLGFFIVWVIVQIGDSLARSPSPLNEEPKPPADNRWALSEPVLNRDTLLWLGKRSRLEWSQGQVTGWWEGKKLHRFETPQDLPKG